MFVLCGFIFPLTVTALGQVLFPEQANGSLGETRWQSNWFKAHWTTMDRT